MLQIINSYHTHTKRCGHASGEDEEYVLAAIKLGIKELGFSDHIILPKGFEQPGVRGSYDLLEDYLNSINHLKEKYKDQIKIYVGFEAEYYPPLIDYYKELLNHKIDFLILGQHCCMKDGHLCWYYSREPKIEEVHKYVDDVLEGLKTGLFKYLCHPDLFMRAFEKWNEGLEKESRRLLKGCEELNIPIELNICGTRHPGYKGYNHSYTNHHFFDLVNDYHLKIVMGMDAHDPSHLSLQELKKGEEFVERHNLVVDMDYRLFPKD